MAVVTGLERLSSESSAQNLIKGNLAYLCHSASIDGQFKLGVFHLQKHFGKRLKKLMGPQHGFVTDVQDNMVETQDFIHPYFKIPVLSLYGKVRIPTDEMLEGIDTVVVDLQDVGTRVYTYINTMTLLMEACGKKDIRVVVLDRPNPVGGEIIEGNILEKGFESFVGRHPIPMRHALTMGEMALYAKKFHASDCDLQVVKMQDWKRSMFFEETGLPWVLPSPNLPTIEGAKVFPGSVLYEGTDISEGRGTTRSLEILGHPKIEAFSFCEKLTNQLKQYDLKGFILRPLVFMPTFQKWCGKPCGGFQIHVTDNQQFRPWRLGQILLKEFYNHLGSDFSWNKKPYEYESEKLAIDYINGTDKLRLWVENNGSEEELNRLENQGLKQYSDNIRSILLY